MEPLNAMFVSCKACTLRSRCSQHLFLDSLGLLAKDPSLHCEGRVLTIHVANTVLLDAVATTSRG